ncbi:MAG: sugar phosphate isomerase/epimerase [Acetobacteraceae bacterium]|nr:sugar phosphate isomerase/epimerase [Acetobacteraceae bacterium]
MKLAVSNIAWDEAEHPAILAALSEGGVTGIEIAPTKIWPNWNGATPEAAARLRTELADQGFAVPALQSILFGRPDLHVFGDAASRSGLVTHIARVAALAGALGADTMVFGSPRNRLRGALSEAAAMHAAAAVFRDIGAACAAARTCLCIEANPPQYGGDFLTRWQEAAELVERVDHPGIGLHLDTACTAMAGDDPVAAASACAGLLRHFHVSAPGLGPVGEPPAEGSPIDHAGIAAALRSGHYAGWVSIEMRRTETPLASVRRAVAFARGCYA